MVRRLLPFLLSLSLALVACSIRFSFPSASTPGPEVVDELTVPWPDGDEPTQLWLKFGGGDLFLSANEEESLLSGSITYNIPDLKPRLEITGNRVEVIQSNPSFLGIADWKNVKNTWRFHLGARPLELNIQAGAYQAEYDLGGLALTSLSIQDGAADVDMIFSEPNREVLSLLRYQTGASDVRLRRLANANFKTMIFKSGAGDYILDFSGNLQRDATVTIETGLSNVILIIPEGTPARVTVESGLANITTEDGWAQRGNTYIQDGEGPSLTIIIQIGAGNLTLTH